MGEYDWCTEEAIASTRTLVGQPAVGICDGICSRAWGLNSSTQEWERIGVAAPADPGTYEGGHAKPTTAEDQHNKWCWRECERFHLSSPGEGLVRLGSGDPWLGGDSAPKDREFLGRYDNPYHIALLRWQDRRFWQGTDEMKPPDYWTEVPRTTRESSGG